MRLQPFEDGNKRTSRIITSYNLWRQNRAPIVIFGEENNAYFDFIDNYDIDGFSKFLEKKSKEELEVMLQLYQSICNGSFEINANLTGENASTPYHNGVNNKVYEKMK